METIELGKTGIKVTRLCVGTWQVSGWVTSNDERFKRTLDHAIGAGINFIDTAELYGEGRSEELIGEVIRGRRDKVVIGSKFSHHHAREKDMREALNLSLKRLGTDYLDLYQHHWPGRDVPLAETLEALLKLKREGKVRAIGVSNYMQPEWKEVAEPGIIDTLQPCYSLLWRSIEKEVLPLCRKHQIAVLAYSPLAQGLLTGRFKSAKETPADWRKRNQLFNAKNFPAVLKVTALLQELAKKHNRPVSAVALRWLLEQPGVTAPVVGASSPEQVDENLKALDWTLPSDDVQQLAEISLPLSAHLKPHDTIWNCHPKIHPW